MHYTQLHDNSFYKSLANCIRFLSADAVEKAASGHPGMPLGTADIITVLFSHFLRFDPLHPKWPNRDRFVLSAGHGSMSLYALLYLTGYKQMTIEEIKNFRQLNSKTSGHPEYELLEGVETTTGPLGQGVANAVGMAIAQKMLNEEFGSRLFDYKIYVIAGDGCMMEGITSESASLAGHLQLNNLIIMYDSNNISIDGGTDLSFSENIAESFKAKNWHVLHADGHSYKEIFDVLEKSQTSDRPVLIIFKTKIGYGTLNKESSEKSHGAPLGITEIEALRNNLQWPYPAFEIPVDLLNQWRDISKPHSEECSKWYELAKSSNYEHFINPDLSKAFEQMDEMKKQYTQDIAEATRKTSGKVIEAMYQFIPNIVGGSADLTESTCTLPKAMECFTSKNYAGKFVHYGVRENAMVSIMNGLALSGFIPYSGTFLVFSDYAKPGIRLAALMGLRVIYIFTHDSIGLGEDGPTHQPIEHLVALRAIPNLLVMRPASSIETIECWKIALQHTEGPIAIVLTRQNVRNINYDRNADVKRGAYILYENDTNPEVTIFATGSEVEIAYQATEKLVELGKKIRLVSMPCQELFDQQDKDYIMHLLCNNSLKVAVEAACSLGWHKYIGAHGIFIGMQSFGLSAPSEDLYRHFGITSDNIVSIINRELDNKKHD